ncbi:MAG TPA: hypothetical protein VMU39_09230 [Solirubrobacteraceae bacterium]|nr:hypothetical protein [Solirubrobacteraceae bacterium]
MPLPRTPSNGTERLDALLIEEIGLACERARMLADTDRGLPTHEVVALRDSMLGLRRITHTEINWRNVTDLLRLDPEFWPHIVDIAEAFDRDSELSSCALWGLAKVSKDPATMRADALRDLVIAPTFRRYGRRRPDLTWSPQLAREMITDCRAAHARDPHLPHQTLGPLRNLQAGLHEPVPISADTVIRPMTDEDRSELWQSFGRSLTVRDPTLKELRMRTHAIDIRWHMPPRGWNIEIAAERIANVVTALRLLHSGVTGTAILWTRGDPPDAPVPHDVRRDPQWRRC